MISRRLVCRLRWNLVIGRTLHWAIQIFGRIFKILKTKMVTFIFSKWWLIDFGNLMIFCAVCDKKRMVVGGGGGIMLPSIRNLTLKCVKDTYKRYWGVRERSLIIFKMAQLHFNWFNGFQDNQRGVEYLVRGMTGDGIKDYLDLSSIIFLPGYFATYQLAWAIFFYTLNLFYNIHNRIYFIKCFLHFWCCFSHISACGFT